MRQFKLTSPVVIVGVLTLCLAVGFASVQSQEAATSLQRSKSESSTPDWVGNAAAYERSRSMRGKWSGKVLNNRIQHAWLNERELFYREEKSASTWNFMVADLKKSKSDVAFDHERVAKEASKLTGRSLDATSLPIASARSLGSKGLALLMQSGEVLRVDGRTVATYDIDDEESFGIPATTLRRSQNLGGSTRLVFMNTSKLNVRVLWIPARGQPREYATLKPGETHSQHSIHGHVWRIETDKGEALGFYQAQSFPGVVKIDGEQHLPTYQRRNNNLGRVSPGNTWEVRVQNDNVQRRKRGGGEWETITTNGRGDDRYDGTFCWSDDDRYLLAMRRTRVSQRTISMVESSPNDRLQPRLHTLNYTKPGDELSQRTPVLIDMEKLETPMLDLTEIENQYNIRDLQWVEKTGEFRFVFNKRGHQVRSLVAIEATSGKLKPLIKEESKTFVDYSQKSWFRTLDNGDVLWMSERDGWNHLYYYDARRDDLKQLTKGEWVVRSVERVDLEENTLTFVAMGCHDDQDPYHRHIGEVTFPSGKTTILTGGDGTCEVDWSPERSHIVVRRERVDLPPVHEVRSAKNGKLVMELTEASASAAEAEGWNAPTRFVAKGRDGKTDIWGYIVFPSQMQEGDTFPVIESIYAGPHGHHVPKSFSTWRGERELSELGFVVVKIDGMGTNWRSKAFHDYCWQDLKDAGFPDRIAWMKAAAKEHPAMDTSRVGIYGGSAGGQNAMSALLNFGDFYNAAAADCGCHDNRMDKIWWNEAWMGWPIGDHYEASSNVEQAHKLKGDLLLTVGELDRNVDPASTMQVVDALIKADKDFELVVFPGAGHGAGGNNYGRRRRADFFVRSLHGDEPRRE